jgi:hypothetical protein
VVLVSRSWGGPQADELGAKLHEKALMPWKDLPLTGFE